MNATRISLFALMLTTIASGLFAADDVFAPAKYDEVRLQVLDWATGQDAKKDDLERVAQVWANGTAEVSATEVLDNVARSFAIADPDTGALLTKLETNSASRLVPEADVLERDVDDVFYNSNMGLYFGRYLSQRRFYDEALYVLEEIDPANVVDPASYFFFRAVCEHHLLMKKEGLASATNLLSNTEDVPVRYSTVAKLMKYDLEALKEESLDEVSRMMRDVERRLALGRGGQKVQKIEDEIIAALDKIIKKKEKEQQGGGGGAGGEGDARGAKGNQPNGAAQDSVIKGSTAPGNVDDKKIGVKSGWGSLPPKEAARAKNLINRKFPTHYRQAIEKYFKKLAKRRGTTNRANSGR